MAKPHEVVLLWATWAGIPWFYQGDEFFGDSPVLQYTQANFSQNRVKGFQEIDEHDEWGYFLFRKRSLVMWLAEDHVHGASALPKAMQSLR